MTAPDIQLRKLTLSDIQMEPSQDPAGEGSAPLNEAPSNSKSEEDEIISIDRIFALDHCRPHGMSEDTSDDDRSPGSPRFAFQIVEAEVRVYAVRISAASTTCSCEEAGICRHGRWLLMQLNRTRLESDQKPDTNLFRYIEHEGVENVCDKLQWEVRGISTNPESDLDSDDTEEPEEWELKRRFPTSQIARKTRGTLKERCDTVRDIMATLCSEPTEHYHQDIFDAEEDVTLRPIIVPGDVGGSFSRWLLQDEESLLRFKPLVPQEMRALAYFKNVARKAYKTCELMDRYANIGLNPGEIVHHDVAWCAQTLSSLVNLVNKNINKRQLNHLCRREASKTLVSILREVVNRNKDVYQDEKEKKVPRRRPHGEPQTNRNLYERLIGSNPAGPMFILRELQDLPEALPFVEVLEEALGKLQTIGWGPAPQAYREKLRVIITQLKGSPQSMSPLSGPSSSAGGKRRGSLMDRKNKRMK